MLPPKLANVNSSNRWCGASAHNVQQLNSTASSIAAAVDCIAADFREWESGIELNWIGSGSEKWKGWRNKMRGGNWFSASSVLIERVWSKWEREMENGSGKLRGEGPLHNSHSLFTQSSRPSSSMTISAAIVCPRRAGEGLILCTVSVRWAVNCVRRPPSRERKARQDDVRHEDTVHHRVAQVHRHTLGLHAGRGWSPSARSPTGRPECKSRTENSKQPCHLQESL